MMDIALIENKYELKVIEYKGTNLYLFSRITEFEYFDVINRLIILYGLENILNNSKDFNISFGIYYKKKKLLSKFNLYNYSEKGQNFIYIKGDILNFLDIFECLLFNKLNSINIKNLNVINNKTGELFIK